MVVDLMPFGIKCFSQCPLVRVFFEIIPIVQAMQTTNATNA